MRRNSSGRETFDVPFGRGETRITETIVQSIGTALPEFESNRSDAITAPVGRDWDGFVLVVGEQLLEALVQDIAVREDLALI